MPSQLNAYVSFKDNARQALEFYKSVFGGKVELHTFDEMPGVAADETDKIMHGMLTADNGITFMAADTPKGMTFTEGARISMSLSGDNEPELRGYWDKLAEGGNITMPIAKAPWGDTFGMLVDKFGIQWMVNIAGPKA